MKQETRTPIRFSRYSLVVLALVADTATASPEMEIAPDDAAGAVSFIQTDINADSRLKGSEIRVEIEEGIAILTGRASSLSQSERAVARTVASSAVKAVVNQVTIDESQSADLLKNSKAALRSQSTQSMMRASDIQVAAKSGHVSLTGEVGTWDEKELAREIISQVPGVSAIENNLTVNFEGVRTDSQIEQQLRFMIQDDPLYEGLHLTVGVKDGTVSLGGTVGNKGEFDRLVRRSYVTGVMDVQLSGLNIDSDLAMEGLADKEYSKDESLAVLKEALNKDSRVNSGGIKLAMNEGVITLKGAVGGVDEKDAVESTARAIPGVLRVSNQLKVLKSNQLAGDPQRIVAVSPPLLKPRSK